MLSDRKRLVLKAVVDGYVRTSEPVGSQSIVDWCNLNVSSATVRNILADLERSGYLIQPHVSAGRVPSDKGYRVYVDKLMTPEALSGATKHWVAEALAAELPESAAILRRAAKLLSELTGYTAIAFLSDISDRRLEGLRLLLLETGKILLLLIPAGGPISHRLAGGGFAVSKQELALASEGFCRFFYDRPAKQIKLEEIDGLFHEYLDSARLATLLADIVYKMISEVDREMEFVEGLTNLFRLSDLHHPDESGAVAELVEHDRDSLLAQLSGSCTDEDVTIQIGGELAPEALHNCSVVTATYRTGEGRGGIGVVGPKRMPYSRVSGSLSYLSKALSDRLQADLI